MLVIAVMYTMRWTMVQKRLVETAVDMSFLSVLLTDRPSCKLSLSV